MIWSDLLQLLHDKGLSDSGFLQETVAVYDKGEGEYYPCDTIEFEESDGIIDAGHIFLQIER
jgi:hypothetical protein